MLKAKRPTLLSVVLSLSLFTSAPSWAGGQHSPLLVLISNKLKLEKLLSEAEQTPSTCSENVKHSRKLLKTSLHLLKDYTQEQEGNYLSQQAYADSLHQRAKMLATHSDFLERLYYLEANCK
jgi:hypothetical protein